MRSKPRALRQLGPAIGAVLALIGCGSQSATPAATAVPGGTANIRIIAPWGTLDPQIQGSKGGYEIDAALYDWLIYFDGHKVLPYLATKWQVTPTTVKFTLRKDATCAGGKPVTPTVVANSFNRFLTSTDPKVASVRRTWPAPYTVRADDAADTVTIGVGKPFSGLLLNFSQLTPPAAIICSQAPVTSATQGTTPEGSGPYKLSSVVTGDSATLVARPDWHWGPDGRSTKSPGVPQTLKYKVVVNETTAANLLETGGLDIGTIGGPDNKRLIADHSLTHQVTHGYSSSLLTFQEAEGHATNDQAVRQALATSVDAKAYGVAAYQGSVTPATSFLTNDATCFDPATKSMIPSPSTTKAKQIMTNAGYQLGGDGRWQDKNHRTMTISMIAEEVQGEGASYLTTQFQAAGFNVQQNQLPETTYAQVYFSGNWDVFINLASSPTPDPNGGGGLQLSTGPIPPNGSNYIRKDYADIDDEIAAANASTGAESCKHWANVQKMFLTRYIFMPLGAPQYQWYSHGFQISPLLDYELSPVFLKRVKQ